MAENNGEKRSQKGASPLLPTERQLRCPYRQDLELLCFEDCGKGNAADCPIYTESRAKENERIGENIREFWREQQNLSADWRG